MLPLRIALRYLFSPKSHSAVNIISFVAMAGLAIATAAMIIVLSVFNGFSQFAAGRLMDFDADLRVQPLDGKLIADADSLALILSHIDGVEVASPIVEEIAYAIAGDRQMPLTINGVTPDSPALTGYPDAIIDGFPDVDRFQDYVNTAIVSVDVANTLRTFPRTPQWVKIHLPRRRGRLNPANPLGAFVTDSVLVTGVFRTEQAEYDLARLIIPLDVARHLMQFTSEASAVDIAITPDTNPDAVRTAVRTAVGPGYSVTDRLERQAHSFRLISAEKWITLLMLIFILLIASFNILSTLAMLIVDKRPNRAILEAMGATPSRIASIFAWLAFLVSSIGGFIGIALGSTLTLIQQFFGIIKLHAADPSRMAITIYPVDLAASDVAIVAAIVLAAATLSAAAVRFSMRP